MINAEKASDTLIVREPRRLDGCKITFRAGLLMNLKVSGSREQRFQGILDGRSPS